MTQNSTNIQTDDDSDERDEVNISLSSTLPDNPEQFRPMRTPRWKQALKNVSIEPLMFLHMFGVSSTGVIVQDLYIQRICTVTLGYTPEECRNLSNIVDADGDVDGNNIERQVDALASKFSLYRGLIETIIPIIFAMFLGSWSDKHGSKFPLLLPIFGYVLSAASYTFFTFLPDLKPEYILMSSIPVSLTGGMVAIVLSSFSFISALTTNENRSFRIAILEACWFSGMPIGLLVGARIYKDLGFAPVFMNAALFFGVALFYGFIFVHEVKSEIPQDHSDCFQDMFNVQSVKDTFWTVFREREGPRRSWILLLILTVCLRIMTLFGPQNCMYLFVRYQFGWTEQEYSTLTTVESILGVLGGVIMTVVFVKIMQVSDPIIGLISCVGFVISNFIVAFAPRGHEYGWMLYLASCIQMFGGMTTIVIRSMISKIVPKQELAKVFTFVACGEAAVPIIANALYSLIFITSEKQFAGAFNLLSASINFWILCHFIYFCISTRRNPVILELQEEPDGTIN